MQKPGVGASELAGGAPCHGSACFDEEIRNEIAAELALEVRHRMGSSLCQIVRGFAAERKPFECSPTQTSCGADWAVRWIDRRADRAGDGVVSEKANLRRNGLAARQADVEQPARSRPAGCREPPWK